MKKSIGFSVILLTSLLQPGYGVDRVFQAAERGFGYFMGEAQPTMFETPQERASFLSKEGCDLGLTADHIKTTLLDRFIPLNQFGLFNPSDVVNQDIPLGLGRKKVQVTVEEFTLSHHHILLDHPLEVSGFFLVASITPSLLTTPALTVCSLGLMGYTLYRAYERKIIDDLGEEDFFNTILGLKTSLSRAVGKQTLFPQISHDFQSLTYEGVLPDGAIPGKGLKYKMVFGLKGYY